MIAVPRHHSPGHWQSSSESAPLPDRGDWLGRGLKRLYASLLREPIPESLLVLLDELERKSEERNGRGEGEAGKEADPSPSPDRK